MPDRVLAQATPDQPVRSSTAATSRMSAASTSLVTVRSGLPNVCLIAGQIGQISPRWKRSSRRDRPWAVRIGHRAKSSVGHILFGFLLTAFAMWQMTQFSLQMGMMPVIISGFVQGFGLGCTQVPLNTLALSTLPPHILTQGTAIRSVMRNLGGSIGISVLVSQLAQNTQIVNARLVDFGPTTR
jgi:MFS family permease